MFVGRARGSGWGVGEAQQWWEMGHDRQASWGAGWGGERVKLRVGLGPETDRSGRGGSA